MKRAVLFCVWARAEVCVCVCAHVQNNALAAFGATAPRWAELSCVKHNCIAKNGKLPNVQVSKASTYRKAYNTFCIQIILARAPYLNTSFLSLVFFDVAGRCQQTIRAKVDFVSHRRLGLFKDSVVFLILLLVACLTTFTLPPSPIRPYTMATFEMIN